MTDSSVAGRVLVAEGFARELQDCQRLEDHSLIVRRLLLDAPPGTLMTLVVPDEGEILRLSQLVSETRRRLEGWTGQPVRPAPRHPAARFPRRVR